MEADMRKVVLIAVKDLLLASRIRETVERSGMIAKVVKDPHEVVRMAREQLPAWVVFDLNDRATRPIETIESIKAAADLQGTRTLGYYSHVQTELHEQASKAGCDLILTRSALTQQLPSFLTSRY
jgi:DNA-binding NarL/FixJ family response regulator